MFQEMNNKKKGINKSDFIELSWGDVLGVGNLLILPTLPPALQ